MDTWYVAVLMEMVQRMHDSSFDSYFMESLYAHMTRLEGKTSELNDDKRAMQRVIENNYSLISELFKRQDQLETTIMALQIQAADSENRADEELHKRISLMLRR